LLNAGRPYYFFTAPRPYPQLQSGTSPIDEYDCVRAELPVDCPVLMAAVEAGVVQYRRRNVGDSDDASVPDFDATAYGAYP
jgi:hypothetical protein